jgi:hypothetical protein
MYVAMGTAAPQLEQKRAPVGNPVPQSWQKTAIVDSSLKNPYAYRDTAAEW